MSDFLKYIQNSPFPPPGSLLCQVWKSCLPTNCLSVFDHFVGLALNGLKAILISVVSWLIQTNTQILKLEITK